MGIEPAPVAAAAEEEEEAGLGVDPVVFGAHDDHEEEKEKSQGQK